MKFDMYLWEEGRGFGFGGLSWHEGQAASHLVSRQLPASCIAHQPGTPVCRIVNLAPNADKVQAQQSQVAARRGKALTSIVKEDRRRETRRVYRSPRFLDLAALQQPKFIFNQMICQMAALLLHVKTEDILCSARNGAKEAFARQLSMYLCHVIGRQSQGVVGCFFARDRKTVSHACRVIEDCRDDLRFDLGLEQVERLASDILEKLASFEEGL